MTKAIVTLQINNAYTDGFTADTTVITKVPVPVPEEGTDERIDWECEYLLPHTGVGRSGDAFYTVEITESSAIGLVGIVAEFGG
ncbi:hypothetical protein ABZW10_28450 [Kitasatospora sp. NPDC004723]|uniref:hypothetical protein n=1 Tax=Kitasatospora sp. NPDC004723 TaxID=3154288 RepID=UPI0033BA67A1